MRWRPTSLFWTFTGAFLVVLAVGIVLQVVLVFGVIRPVTRHWMEEQALATARAGAEAIGRALESDPSARISPVLRAVTTGKGLVTLVYRNAQGRVVAVDRSMPGLRRELRDLEDDRRLRWRDRLAPRRGSTEDGPPGGGPPEVRPPEAGLPEGDSPGDFAPGPPPDSGPPPPDGGEPGGRPRFYTLVDEARSRAPVTVHGQPAGEVIGLVPPMPLGSWPSGVPQSNLLFLPVAAILAGVAGLLLFRSFSRRLDRLQVHAERVAQGDLDARVSDPRLDEIGRLAQSLNQMSERLAGARRGLEEADRQRRQLLADVTHELSTPLTTIRGFTETLLDPEVPKSDDERESYLRDIQEEARRIDLLVHDLLDLARLEAGSTQAVAEWVDWGALARGSVRRFEPLAREAGLMLSGPAEPEKPLLVRGDPRRLEQLLDNLLMNALRYVPRGGRVGVTVERNGANVVLRVEDDGPGFTEADLPHIFDRFYRGDRARSAGGSGLGLALVREIARSHGGQARAENRPEGGARLWVELPAV